MATGLAFILAFNTQTSGVLPIPALPNPEAAVAQVRACGFTDVSTRFDETLQEDVVDVAAVVSASDEQLLCVARASLETHYYVLFPSPLGQAYGSIYWRLSEERGREDARAWLKERGLLDRVPQYKPSESDDAKFVRTLESICGEKAIGALQPLNGMATIRPGTLESGKVDDETLTCLLNVAAASGYHLGFIGNEMTESPR